MYEGGFRRAGGEGRDLGEAGDGDDGFRAAGGDRRRRWDDEPARRGGAEDDDAYGGRRREVDEAESDRYPWSADGEDE
jgi:hypothetical protein